MIPGIVSGFKSIAGDGVTFDKVRLLLHCNGANDSIVLTDSSSYNRPMTRVGAAKIATDYSVYGGASLKIGSDVDGFTTPAAASLDMRGGAFQIDLCKRLDAAIATGAYDTVLSMADGSTFSYEWALMIQRYYLTFYWGRRGTNQAQVRFYWPGGIDLATMAGQFLKLSLARDASGNFGAWLNGARYTQYQYAPLNVSLGFGGVTTGTFNNGVDFGASAGSLRVGSFFAAGLAQPGRIDELRYATAGSRDALSDYIPLETPFPDSD